MRSVPRLSLLLLLIIPLLFCCISVAGYAGLWTAGPDGVDLVVGPLETADYGPWPYLRFGRMSTALATHISAGGSSYALNAETGVEVAAEPTLSIATPIPTSMPSMTPVYTHTPSPTFTPVATMTDTATATLTPTSTATPTRTPTQTPTLTSTPTPTATLRATLTRTATSTATSTYTATLTRTITHTPTYIVTATPTNPPTSTSTPTHTATSTATPTSTALPTDTPTSTSTPTHTATSTATPTDTPAPPTPTPTNTPDLWQRDYGILISASNPMPDPGSTVLITVTIDTVFAASDGVVNGLQIRSLLPAGLNYVSHTLSSGSYNSGSGIWQFNLGYEGTKHLYITTTVTASPGATITSTATLINDSWANETNPANNSASVNLNVQDNRADLSLAGVFSNLNPVEGELFISTLTISNSGPRDATNVRVRLSGAGSLTSYLSHTATIGSYTLGDSDWIIPFIAAGASGTLEFTNRVNAGTAGMSFSGVRQIIASDQSDPDSVPNNSNPAEDDQAGFTLTIRSSADLEFNTFSVSNPAPVAGDNITIMISITNNGPQTATNIVLGAATGTPITGILGFVSANATHGAYTSGMDTWIIPSLNAGETATLELVSSISSGAAGLTITRSREIAASDLFDPDSTPANGSTSEDDDNSYTFVVQPAGVDLAVSMAVDNNNPVQGELFNYTITLTNNGSLSAASIQVQDILPGALALRSYGVSQGSYTPASGLWDIGTLSSGNAATLTLTAWALPAGSPTDVINTASITNSSAPDPVNGNNTASVTILPVSPPACAFAGEPDFGAADGAWCSIFPGTSYVADLGVGGAIGTTSGYDLVFHEIESGVASQLSLDVIRVEVSNDLATWHPVFDWGDGLVDSNTNVGAAGYGSTGEPNETLIPMATPALYGSAPYITGIAIDVDAVAPAGAYRYVRLTAYGTSRSQLDAIYALSTTPPEADLGVAIAASNLTPTAGVPFDYTITVTNYSPVATSNVQIQDILPSGIGFISQSATQGSYNPGTGVWGVGTLASNGTATLTIAAWVQPNPGDETIVNTATIINSGLSDPVSGNNTASVSIVTVNPAQCPTSGEPDLGSADGAWCNVLAGTTYTVDLGAGGAIGTTTGYDLVFHEVHGRDTTNQIALDSIRVSVSSDNAIWYEVFDWGDGVVDSNSNIGVAGYGSGGEVNNAPIPMSAPPLYGSAPYISGIAIDIDAVAPPGVYRYVRLHSYGPEGTELDAVYALSTTPPQTDLALSKAVDNASPFEGDLITYTITLTNNGPHLSTNAQVTDIIPLGLSFSSAIASSGTSYNDASDTWTVPNLSPSASATLQLAVQVAAGNQGTTITNTAAITLSALPDPNSANNSASAPVNVQLNPTADVAVSVGVDNPNPTVGDTIIYTINLTNTGDPGASVTVQNALPVGLNFVGATPSQGSYNQSTQEWSVTPGAGASLQITATVDASAAGQTLTHPATIIQSSLADPDNSNNSASTDIVVAGVDILRLEVVVSPTNPSELAPFTYTLTVTNNTGVPVSGIQVTDNVHSSEITIDFISSAQGSYTIGSGLWDVGTLGPAASASITLNAHANPGTAGTTVTKTISISASSPVDSEVLNNSSSPVVDVAP